MKIYRIYSDMPIFSMEVTPLHPKFPYEMQVQAKGVSDGYHTMSELYEHRYALFAALLKVYDNYITPLGATPIRCWKSKVHHDGTMFEDSFVAGMNRKNLDNTQFQISYHLPLSWWDKIKVMELPHAPEWDGHTSDDVLRRLMML